MVGKGYKWVRKGKRIKNKKKEVWKVVREGKGKTRDTHNTTTSLRMRLLLGLVGLVWLVWLFCSESGREGKKKIGVSQAGGALFGGKRREGAVRCCGGLRFFSGALGSPLSCEPTTSLYSDPPRLRF